MKKALITGIVGQDGSYLAEFLLKKNYSVTGIVRRASYPHTQRIDHLRDQYDDRDPGSPFRLFYGDLSDVSSLRHVIETTRPDEIYNLAAQSHVGISFETGEVTLDINTLGTYRILEIIRTSGGGIKFYQASSSEMFGLSPPPQAETTPLMPQSPYGVSKAAAYHLTRLYRGAYRIFACSGILFNHESPRRGLNFVTRKITRGLAGLLCGKTDILRLGNIDSKRDWGFAGDYVEAIWKIMQHGEADDFVIATGETHTVSDFLETCFSMVGLNWRDHVEYDQARYRRPAEVPVLLGDPSKARRVLKWKPRVNFEELCAMMVREDLKQAGLTLEEARRRAGRLSPR